MPVVPRTTSFRAPWFFVLCCGALACVMYLVPDTWVAKALASPEGLALGQKVYLILSLALCLTVFVFGAGPLSQHGRWAAPPGWTLTPTQGNDNPDGRQPPPAPTDNAVGPAGAEPAKPEKEA